MKNLITIIICFFTAFTFAQKTLFETLEANGSEAVYQRYYSVYEDDNGKQKVSGKQYQLKAEILKFDGVYAGIKMVAASKEDKAGMSTIDATKSKSSQIIGYPNVSHVVDRISRKGFVAIDDFIFKLGNVWKAKDGIGFNDIDEIYIRVGAEGTVTKSSDEKKKKKKKFGSFLNKVKDAAMNKPVSECTTPGCKKAESMDLEKYVRDYLKKMEAKQKAYTLTVKDKTDITTIDKAVNDYYKYVNNKNDAYWKSEEGQAILRNRRNAESFDAVNTVKLKNNTGKEIYIGNSNQSKTIYNGSTGDWDCKRDAYILYKIDGSNYKVTSQKIYSANSNCGGSKTIN